MKRALLVLVICLAVFQSSFAKCRVTFMGQEMREFWGSGTYEPYVWTVAAAGLMYGGYRVITSKQDQGPIGYAAGSVMLLGGMCGACMSVGFDLYFE